MGKNRLSHKPRAINERVLTSNINRKSYTGILSEPSV